MKSLFNIFFLMLTLPVFGQRYDHVGIYKGAIMNEDVNIDVTFEFKKDSTYKINMNYNFKEYCTGKDVGSMNFAGYWKADEEWLFLDPLDLGINIFFQYETWSKHDKEVMERNIKKDRLPLKVTFESKKCPRINFRINAECFKEVWIYHSVDKAGCVNK